MAINFPSTAGQPTNGSYTFTVLGITYSWDGESWNALGLSHKTSGSGGGSLVKHGTVATNTGTEAAFTNIPSTAKKITVAIHNFGFSGSSDDFIMEVGDSNGYATSGYQSSYDSTTATNAGRVAAYGLTPGTDPGLEYNITVELVNVTGNSWTISHTGGDSTSLGSVIYGGGSISLTNALDRLRIKTENGRTLDHGHVTVYYETEGSAGSGQVSVKDFGAIGNGVTDDTTAIQAAVDVVAAAGGGQVYLPAGTYLVENQDADSTVSNGWELDTCVEIMSSNVHLKGAGTGATVIKKTQNTRSAHIIKIGRRSPGVPVQVSNCSVSALSIEGNIDSTSNTNNNLIDVSSGCTDITLEDLELKNAPAYGIGMQRDGFNNCLISDVTIEETGRDGIDFKMDTNASGLGNLIRNVTVKNFGRYTTAGVPQAGIDVRCGVSVRDCYVDGIPANAVGCRVNNSADLGETQASVFDNIKCVAASLTNTKGFQFVNTRGKYSNLQSEGAYINYWVRCDHSQFNNLISKGGTFGVWSYASGTETLGYNTFVNLLVDGATDTAIKLEDSSSNVGISNDVFMNFVAINNASDVEIDSGIPDTRFIGGNLSSVSDNGVRTQFVGTSGVLGPAYFGRNNNQHWKLDGNGSNNELIGVSPSGSGKQTVIKSDANSAKLELATLSDNDIVFYRNGHSADNINLRVTDPTQGSQTGLALRVNLSGSTVVRDVFVGGTDSGGSGYRILRIANS